MAIDLYALCPCGSGKKIKFCCRDLAGEIEKIERLREAGQRKACLEHIELLEKKYPNRSYLMTTKAELLRELGREADADGTLQELLEHEQQNPVALAESALLALSKDEEAGIRAAVERVQRAVEAAPRDPWPEKVKEAIAAVADECFAEGYLPACLAHTVLFLESEPENEGAAMALARFAESAQVPLLFKELRSFQNPPADAPWVQEFNQAMTQADRGAWLRAEERLTTLAEQVDDAPALWNNLAVLRTWLAKEEEAVAALRKLAVLEIPLEEAVEAEALALEIDPSFAQERMEETQLTYPIADMERIIAAASSDKRLVEAPAPPAADGQPPPKSLYIVLDRDAPESAEEVTLDTRPMIGGYLSVFGRETDREARLEFYVQRDEHFEENLQLVPTIFGDAVGTAEEEKTGETQYLPCWALEQSWLPPDARPDVTRDLRYQAWRRHLFDVWPGQPWAYLDGKTPAEASQERDGQVKLLGVLLYMELNSQRNRATDFDFNELRRHLGLPEAGPIDPAEVDLSDVPLARLARLQMEKLSDDDLLRTFARSVHYRAASAAQHAALELVSRESLDERVDKPGVYTTLAHLADDSRQALEYVDRARRITEEDGGSSAGYDIHELTLRLRRGDADDVSRLIDHIMDEHIDEPGVRQAMREVFIMLGMLNPDGSIPQRAEPEAVAAAASESAQAESSTIWTPESEARAAGGEKPKILLPE